ncbi:MAG: HTH domain-containing protein [Longicatena sp.]
MLAKRNIRILKRLMQEKNFLSIQKLSKELAITTRAIRYDITIIDQFLLDNGMNRIEKTPNKGIKLALQPHELKTLNEMLGQDRKDAYILSKEERQTFLLDCLLKKDGVITLQEMADSLEVSVSTINKDMVNVKKSLEEYGITLGYKNKDFYALAGKEKDIRNYFSNLYLAIVHEDFMYRNRTLIVSNHKTLLDPPLVSKMTGLIESMEDYFQLQLTDDSLLYMVSRLYVMYIRLLGGNERLHRTFSFISTSCLVSGIYEALF